MSTIKDEEELYQNLKKSLNNIQVSIYIHQSAAQHRGRHLQCTKPAVIWFHRGMKTKTLAKFFIPNS